MGQEGQVSAGPRLLPGETVLHEVDGLSLRPRYHVRSESIEKGLTGWYIGVNGASRHQVLRLTSQRLIATFAFQSEPTRHFSCPRLVGLFEATPSQRIEYPMFGKPKTTDTDHKASLLLAGGLALDITLPYPEKPDATSHAAFLVRSERLSLLLATALLRLGGGDDDAPLIAAAETEASAGRRRQD